MIFYLAFILLLIQIKGEYIQKGITFTNGKYCPNVTFGSEKAFHSLIQLKNTGATHVAIIVTQYSDNINSTEIYPVYSPIYHSYYTYSTADVENLTLIINHAHNIGLKVMLKPHIDLIYDDAHWRGNIGMKFNKEQWNLWFKSYTKFILEYAILAQDLKAEIFSLSCELIYASLQEDHWRKLIPLVRKVYKGKLTDSANWGGEEVDKKWWDLVDIIGIDAYYPVVPPSLKNQKMEDFLEGWKGPVNIARKLNKKFNKQVVYTEIGYCSGCQNNTNKASLEALMDQSNFYESALMSFRDIDFFEGFYWWNWDTDPASGGFNDYCFTPQYKLAEQIIRTYYNSQYPPNVKPDFKEQCVCVH